MILLLNSKKTVTALCLPDKNAVSLSVSGASIAWVKFMPLTSTRGRIPSDLSSQIKGLLNTMYTIASTGDVVNQPKFAKWENDRAKI